MGHLNSFSASGVGNLNKNFPKIQMPGGGCLSFDLTDTLQAKESAHNEANRLQLEVLLEFNLKFQCVTFSAEYLPLFIVHSTKLLNFDWSRAVQLIPNCTP